MFIVLLILCLISTINCETEDPNDLYFVFIPKSRDYKISIRLNDSNELLQQDGFDISRKTVMYAGGIHMLNHLELFNEIVDNYLSVGNYNVIHLDYDAYSEKIDSTLLKDEFNFICKQFADAILHLISLGMYADSIEIVGHSLGSEVVARIGVFTNFKLGLVVGLDPPNYNESWFKPGLAQYTIALWTDRGNVSNPNTNGDIDYMVNNGTGPQPGCDTSILELHGCNHLRAADIWANIVIHPELFYGILCNVTDCDGNQIKQLGSSTRLYGQYYFVTSDKTPFGLGIDGARRFKN